MLERENVSSNKEVLTDSEIIELVPSTIVEICNGLKDKISEEEIIESLADVLDLMQLYSIKRNVDPTLIVQVAQKLHAEKGSFKHKK